MREHPKRIVCIDDDRFILHMVEACLEQAGNYEIRRYQKAREALAELAAAPPDLVLLDVMMPELDGPATYREIRKIAGLQHVPIVFLTGKTDAEDQDYYLRLGAAGIIPKPFEPTMLLALINRLFGRREAVSADVVDTPPPPPAEKKVSDLRMQYLEQLRIHRSEFRDFALRCFGALPPEEAREAIRVRAHSLAGSGTTYGFPRISDAARVLEKLLEKSKPDLTLLLAATKSVMSACEHAQDAPPPVAPHAKTEAAGDGTLPLLLTVDDDESICNLVGHLFRDAARVIAGTNSQDALNLMRERHPDLVLLDDMMPGGVSGIRLLEDIRQYPDLRHIPIIMLTASNKPQDMMRAITAGALDYVTKPFRPEELNIKVRALLKRFTTRVLIAGEDEELCETIAHKFHLGGLEVIQAVNSDEVLNLAREQKPRLIVLENDMLTMEGSDLVECLREDESTAAIPILFITTHQHRHDGSDRIDCIVKPFMPEQIVVHAIRMLGLNG